MHATDFTRDEPWYRNPWVWLVIAIPALTVAGCIVTVILALTHPDYLVRDASAETSQAETAARDTVQ
jgi:hypothetical protein